MQQSGPNAFDDWLRQTFDHPVTNPAWYWDCDAEISDPAVIDCVAYLTRLFEEADVLLAPYADDQVNQGLWYLVDNCCSNHIYSLIEPDVAWPARRRGLGAIATLFERLFARRCSNHLSHLDEKGASPLNGVCYMWWDVFPTYGRPLSPVYPDVDAALLAVMKQVLALDSLPCQESALHGLGHWQHSYPEFVE